MTPTDALTEIKKELDSLFGKGMTGLIMISARNKAKFPLIMKEEHFLVLVDKICADERMVGMLGAAGSKQKSARWKKLLG